MFSDQRQINNSNDDIPENVGDAWEHPLDRTTNNQPDDRAGQLSCGRTYSKTEQQALNMFRRMGIGWFDETGRWHPDEESRPAKQIATSNTNVINRARAYISKIPPAVSGEGGHNQTFKVALYLVKGFSLSAFEAMPLLKEYSDRCRPPGDDNQLRHKLKSAENARVPQGFLLGDNNYHARQSNEQKPSRFKSTKVWDARSFAHADFKLKWLVQRLMVRNQPYFFAGPRKTLKTSIMADLAVSVASGTPFLGKFTTYQALPVLIISGESGEGTLQELLRRICRHRGVSLSTLPITLMFDMPRLTDPADVEYLKSVIEATGAKLMQMDPLYPALLAGSMELSASNLYDIGPILYDVTRMCTDVDCTPFISHHTKKHTAKQHSEPLDLTI